MAPGTTAVKACSTCEHAAFGSEGTYCTMFNEVIWREVEVAAECPEYDPVPWADKEE
jgi:hypothetical protein